MSDPLPHGKQLLKRQSNRRMPVSDPLELFYAGIGYIGVLYESQLVYIKHELDAISPSDPADQMIQSMQAGHAFLVDLLSRGGAAGAPLNQSVGELVEANRGAVQQLAAEGRDLMKRIQEERKRR